VARLDDPIRHYRFGILVRRYACEWTLRGFRLPPAIAGLFVFVGIWLDPNRAHDLRERASAHPGHTGLCYRRGRCSTGPFVAPALPRWLLTLGDASYSIYLSLGFVLPAFGILVSTIVSRGLWDRRANNHPLPHSQFNRGTDLFFLIESPTLHAMRRGTTLWQHDKQ
jgi:hypothetical protein